MNNKKILVLYTTAGMGHKKAANAIFEALDKKSFLEKEIIDILDYSSSIYKFLYTKGYDFLMKHAKWLWSLFYYITNNKYINKLTYKIRRKFDFYSVKKLIEQIEDKSPDIIISTHFILSSISKYLKENNNIKSKLFIVITDYGLHSYWLDQYIDVYFIAGKQIFYQLKRNNINIDKIYNTGIPISSKFFNKLSIKEKRLLYQEYKIEEDKKNILIMSGGFGVGPIEQILLLLNKSHVNIQVIVVCGYNKELYSNVVNIEEKLGYNIKIIGFTNHVSELMDISDLILTKAGGITVTESISKKLPMLFFNSIPGQETWNEKYLMNRGIAKRALKIEQIPKIIDEIFLDENNYKNIKNNFNKIKVKNSAREIVDIILNNT